jgi:hypothetical protein
MIDRAALAARVQAVDATATVHEYEDVRSISIRARRSNHQISIGISTGGLFPKMLHAESVLTKRDRAILRAVLNFMDEAEGV